MDSKFLNFGSVTVFKDKTKGGLLSQFIKEYVKHFGGNFNLSCPKCKTKYWENYKNLHKMKSTSKYVLKAKYNGIQLGVNGQPLRNGEMTDKQAKELISKHPKGKDLFEKYPKVKLDEVVDYKSLLKTDLVKYANSVGVEVTKSNTMNEIYKKLEEKDNE